MPEIHICFGPMKSPHKIKPKKYQSFQDISEKYNNYESYSNSVPKVNPKYYPVCFIVIALAVILSFIYSLDVVQVDYWMRQVFINLIGTVLAFGIGIIFPLMFTKPNSPYWFNLTQSMKNAVVKIVFYIEVSIFFIGLIVAGQFAYLGGEDFGTIFWIFIGLANFLILGFYLEVKTRFNESNQLAVTLKRIIIFSIILISLNIILLVLLGFLTSWSITPSSTIDSFLEYYWIYYCLFLGFHSGRIGSRW